ncbi:MAG: DinB family protein [Gemmatimonadales bacterium]
MVTIQELLQELEQETPSTRRVLELVPEDKLGWKPHEKSMSLGQLALHVAGIPGRIADISTRPTFDVRTQIPRPSPASVAELLSELEGSVQKAKAILGGMDDASLSTPWKMMDAEREIMAMPRVGLLRTVLFNHLYHHRGQLTVYLRMVGARVPAVYGSSADENPLAATT